MKEVKEKRYAGPYVVPPYDKFIQSPIGLVSKDGSKDVRLIFHLSYPRNGDSVNSQIPRELCTVKYCEFDDAIKRCTDEGVGCSISRSDMKAAFRNLGLNKSQWPLLLMKARSPQDGKWYYFVDKCLPFGAAISCKLFQEFSNAVAHIVGYFTQKKVINYLDDYLFAALIRAICNGQVEVFLEICAFINFPVSMEKTFWGCTCLTFLGLLIDTVKQLVCIPVEKVERAIELIESTKNKRKITLHELQKLCGFLNFLCRAIVPGRAFTRRLYAYTTRSRKNGKSTVVRTLLPHHHIQINGEMRADLNVWLVFLQHPSAYATPFMDYTCHYPQELDFYTDASRNFSLGFGGYCQNSWTCQRWDQFTAEVKPSIEFLELYAVTVAVLLWIGRFKNRRIVIFCDYESVVHMLNNSSSSCRNCMVLIRLITLESLYQNVRIFAKHVGTKFNGAADALSRMQLSRFRYLRRKKSMDCSPEPIPGAIWPIEKIWLR